MNKKMSSPAHPSSFVPASATRIIRELAPEAERLGRLHMRQLSVICEQGWFNLYVPEQYGGLALSLPEGLRIEEGLAWVDGSAGWTVTLCSGANWFAGFLNPETAKKLFKDPFVCLAGSGRPSGIARRTGSGYTITGSWDWATGAPHATAFTANCVIEEGGVPLKNDDGSSLVRSFVFLREEVRVEQNWRVSGLIATASHRFGVQDLRVEEDRCFVISRDGAVLPQPIYQYPFLQLAETTLAVNSSGMAARFIELGEPIIAGRAAYKNGGIGMKDGGGLSLRLAGEAKEKLQVLRRIFYDAIDSSWEVGLRIGKHDDGPEHSAWANLLGEVSSASRGLAAGARQIVDELYPFCGLSAADPDAAINRVWRDLHTASQHPLLLQTV
ncbi:MAG: acyl-CoA dehydrogenase family protein [Puia sp.]|nr:acyl-CoA dehydrogenase family protein [Puia sp.]